MKLGDEMLPEKEYVKLFDQNNVYLCTSYQEGGPLPAMEAMARGMTVLTTPVGQIQELITGGENGFICKTKEDFLDKIELLNNDLSLLQEMRTNAIKTIEKKRDVDVIKKIVRGFLKNLNSQIQLK